MLSNTNMAQTLGTTAGNFAGMVRGTAVARSRSVLRSLSHSDSSGERQGYQRITGNGLLGAEPENTMTLAIKPSCHCLPGDPSDAIWARLIVSRALSS